MTSEKVKFDMQENRKCALVKITKSLYSLLVDKNLHYEETMMTRTPIDDIAFKKKQMNSGWWGLSRETISLLYLRHNHFSCGIFFCLIPLPIPQCIVKSSNAISSISWNFLNLEASTFRWKKMVEKKNRKILMTSLC